LKYTKEYAQGAFDGKRREALYDLSEVKDFCRAVDQASLLPWVILSGGVDIDEFVENAKLATAAGASGMLCGRAIWKDCVEFYPNLEAMEAWLATSGVNNFKRLEVVLQEARPWFEHRKFKGFPNLALPNAGEGWHKEA